MTLGFTGPDIRRIGSPPRTTGRRIAIVGLGGMGARHITAALRRGHVIAGLVDPGNDPVGLRENPTLAPLKVNAMADLDPAAVDALVIATTAHVHHRLVCDAISLGFKRIVLEKPATQSVEQAIDIERRAVDAKVRISVNHGRRYCEAYARVRALTREMGDIRSLTLRSGGGALGCVGTHWIDLATTLINAAPVSVFAAGTDPVANPRGAQFIDPGASAMIIYANGAVAFIDTRDDVGFMGGLSISFGRGELTYTNEFAPWTLRQRTAGDRSKPLSQYGLPLADVSAFAPSAMSAEPDKTGATTYSGREAILAYAAACIDDALGDHPIISGIDAAIQTMSVFAAARASMTSGQAVRLASLSQPDRALIFAIP